MFLRSLLAAAAAFAFSASPVPAQSEVVNGQKYGAWTVSCEALGKDRTTCVLTQRLNRDTDGAFIAQILALWSADGEKAYIAARVPMGAYLPGGFILQGEKAETGIPFVWQSCFGQVCEAMREVEGDMLETLSVDNETVLGQFKPRLDMEPFVFRFSMAGVIEGMEALRPVQ